MTSINFISHWFNSTRNQPPTCQDEGLGSTTVIVMYISISLISNGILIKCQLSFSHTIVLSLWRLIPMLWCHPVKLPYSLAGLPFWCDAPIFMSFGRGVRLLVSQVIRLSGFQTVKMPDCQSGRLTDCQSGRLPGRYISSLRNKAHSRVRVVNELWHVLLNIHADAHLGMCCTKAPRSCI